MTNLNKQLDDAKESINKILESSKQYGSNGAHEVKFINRGSSISIQSLIKDSGRIKIEDPNCSEYLSQTNSLKHSDNVNQGEKTQNTCPLSLLVLRVSDCLSLGVNQLNVKVLADDKVKSEDQLKLNSEVISSNDINLPFNLQDCKNSSDIEYRLKFSCSNHGF